MYLSFLPSPLHLHLFRCVTQPYVAQRILRCRFEVATVSSKSRDPARRGVGERSQRSVGSVLYYDSMSLFLPQRDLSGRRGRPHTVYSSISAKRRKRMRTVRKSATKPISQRVCSAACYLTHSFRASPYSQHGKRGWDYPINSQSHSL